MGASGGSPGPAPHTIEEQGAEVLPQGQGAGGGALADGECQLRGELVEDGGGGGARLAETGGGAGGRVSKVAQVQGVANLGVYIYVYVCMY